MAFFVLVFWRKKLKKEIKYLGLDIVRLMILNHNSKECSCVIELGN
jgi:hypothetical protein